MENLQPTQEQPSRTARMKSAYNRGALGVGALYEIYQTIGSVLLVLASVIATITVLRPYLDAHGLSENLLDGILEALLGTGAIRWIVIVYAVGMVIGMLVGLFVMRLIVQKPQGIEKRALSVGQFCALVAIAFALWGVGVLIGTLPALFGVTESNGLDALLEGLTTEALPMYLYVCIGAPIFEELACRKLLLDRIHPYGEGYAMVVSGLLFALIHGNSRQFFLAFLLGLLFALVYLRTGHIGYTIALHAIINTTVSLPEILALFTDVDISLGWTIAIVALGVLGAVLLIWKLRKGQTARPTASDAPDASCAVWSNVGMILLRVVGLITLGVTDLVMMGSALLQGQGPAALLRLIPTTLAFLTVLLLPKLTKRFEQPTVPAEVTEDGNEPAAV